MCGHAKRGERPAAKRRSPLCLANQSTVGARYLSIRVERSGQVEGKHRSEFRYGSFSRTLELPPGADADDVTAEYANGILTIKVAVKDERQEAVKKIPVTSGKK